MKNCHQLLRALLLVCALPSLVLGATPQERSGWINVKEHGVRGDGAGDESQALKAVIDAAPEGSVIYFPAGIYPMRAMLIENKRKLMLVGDGAASVLATATTDSRNYHTIDFIDCEDLTLRDLKVDTTGAQRYGGIAFYGGDRVLVEKSLFTNSKPNIISGRTDRFAVIFIGTKDVKFINNTVEFLQVEFNHARRVHVTGNKLYKPIHNGIVYATITDGSYGEEIIISNNIIEDPLGIGIGFNIDNNGNRTHVTKVLIQNNLIVSHGMPNTDVLAISFGTRPFVRNGITGYWGDITISDNMIVYYPGDVNSEFGGIVFAQAFKSNMYVQNVAIRNNQIISHGTVDADKPVAYTYLDGKPIREEPRWREGFGGIYLQQIAHSTIEGNVVRGLPWGLTMTNSKSNVIRNNTVTDISKAAFLFRNLRGDNVFTDNIVFGDTPETVSTSGLTESDQIDRPLWKKSVPIEDIADSIGPEGPYYVVDQIKEDRVTFSGEIVDVLPAADGLVIQRGDGTKVTVRVSPWWRKRQKLGTRVSLKCIKTHPYGELLAIKVTKLPPAPDEQ